MIYDAVTGGSLREMHFYGYIKNIEFMHWLQKSSPKENFVDATTREQKALDFWVMVGRFGRKLFSIFFMWTLKSCFFVLNPAVICNAQSAICWVTAFFKRKTIIKSNFVRLYWLKSVFIKLRKIMNHLAERFILPFDLIFCCLITNLTIFELAISSLAWFY